MKKIEGRPFGDLKKFPRNILKMRFLNSVTVPKNVEGGPFAIFWHPLCCVAKCRNKWRGDPLMQSKNFPKNAYCWKKWGYGGILSVISRFWTSVLFFLFVLDALLRFELLRFEVVEQMNKKVDLTRQKKLPTLNAPTKNVTQKIFRDFRISTICQTFNDNHLQLKII